MSGPEPPVHQRHLQLELEVRHGPQAAHDHRGLLRARRSRPAGRRTSRPRRSAYSRNTSRAIVHALLGREQRVLLGVAQDRHDDAVEQPRAAQDDVDVAVGQRIERPRIDRHAFAGRAHASSVPRGAPRRRASPVERQGAVAGRHLPRPARGPGRGRRRRRRRACSSTSSAARRPSAPAAASTTASRSAIVIRGIQQGQVEPPVGGQLAQGARGTRRES